MICTDCAKTFTAYIPCGNCRDPDCERCAKCCRRERGDLSLPSKPR